MPKGPPLEFEQAMGVLRQFRGDRNALSRSAERCELCSAVLRHDHPHLLELVSRQVLCACDACALLFDGIERSKFKRIPMAIESLPNFKLTDAQWDGLMIPIQLAFFFKSSLDGRTMAFYPSPAGAVESLVTLRTWNEIVENNAQLLQLRPDVEALLVNRIQKRDGQKMAEHFIVGIDQCYRLVGLIRLHWKGLSGGAEVWDEIEGFFAGLRERSESPAGAAHA